MKRKACLLFFFFTRIGLDGFTPKELLWRCMDTQQICSNAWAPIGYNSFISFMPCLCFDFDLTRFQCKVSKQRNISATKAKKATASLSNNATFRVSEACVKDARLCPRAHSHSPRERFRSSSPVSLPPGERARSRAHCSMGHASRVCLPLAHYPPYSKRG